MTNFVQKEKQSSIALPKPSSSSSCSVPRFGKPLRNPPATNMDGRDEAARWINLALKLLGNRDLVGTKTFAIRAKEADPTMGYAEEILAVVDTLMAGHQQQINGRYDWYAILRVDRLCRDTEVIAGEYKRLALLLNPQRNELPFAEEAFGLVNEAWSVLSNPLRKSLYDNELSWLDSSSGGGSSGVRDYHQIQQHQFLPMQSQPQSQQQPKIVTPVRVQPQVVMPLRAQQQQYQHVQQQVQHQALYQPQFQPRPQPQQQVQFQQLTQQRRVQSQPASQPQIHLQPLPQQRVQSQPVTRPKEQCWPQAQVQSEPVTQRQTQHQVHVHTRPQQQQAQFQQHQSHQSQQEPIPLQGDLNPPIWKTPVRNMEEEEEMEVEEVEADPVEGYEDEVSTFWTACPYCYHLFEYLNEYEDCTLRCQNKNCRRAFHGSAITPPSLSKSDKKVSFCSWGVFPIGASPVSLNSGKRESGKHSWHPFSPMFTCPTEPSKGVAPVAPNSWNSAQPKPKAVIVDDDDYVLMELSDSTDGSDTDWGSNSNITRKKKRGRPPRVHKSPVRSGRRGTVEKSRSGTSEAEEHVVRNNGNMLDAFTNEGAGDAAAAKVTGSKSGLNGNGSLSKKASGNNPKDLGKLDLNVEFNNEVEETMSTKTSTNGAETSAGAGTSTGAGTLAGTGTTSGGEENIEGEGIGFFEGLDEFLNSLPILSAVGDDKVKTA